MLKKKNMAIMMAVATVATTVAPAFAATVEEQVVSDEAKLISDVQKMLDTKYTNVKENGEDTGVAQEAYQNSVYKITVTGTNNVIENVQELKVLIENSKLSSAPLKLTVVDKGHKEVNGAIVSTETNDFVKYGTNLPTAPAGSAIITGITQNSTTAATITLANKETIEITGDDYVLDFNKPVDKNGNLVAQDATGALAEKVVGFQNKQTGVMKEQGIPAKVISKIDFRNDGFTKTEENISKYIVDGIYTETGAELVNTLVDANKNANQTKVIKDGKIHYINFDKNNDLTAVEAVKEGGYKFTINLGDQTKDTNENKAIRNVQMTIKADSQKQLADLRTAMAGSDKVESGKGTYTTLAGDDRFATAVEISKESYVKHDATIKDSTKEFKANGIVLVGEDAIVDGLASAPLAKQKQAPVLLTKKDAVGEATLTEMKRVIEKGAKDKTIYLVGGEAVISKNVEAQLIKELNVQIVRLAGDDRFETSMEIANEITKGKTITDTFVVGADGEADAMSIAAVASMKTDATNVAPIIVTPANGLTKDAKNYLKTITTNIDVIGGESKVSTQVLKDIKEASNQTAERIAGETRHETNANVIAKTDYFKTGVSNAYVAKDGYVEGNGKLIDALSVAPLAGKNNAPIVLATEDLTNKQAEALVAKTNTSTTNHLNKVGNGVSATVMTKMIKILGLNK
jgi:putative cell wall-binding protein